MKDAVALFQEWAEKGQFLINDVLTDTGEKLTGHRKGVLCPKTQEHLQKVVDKGGKVPVKEIVPGEGSTASDTDFKIDWAFIAKMEGTIKKMYVPCDKNGNVLGVSGPTIASGFDLGQTDLAGLQSYHFPSDLETKLRPYVGKKGAEAKTFVQANPVTITDADVVAINKKVKRRYAEKTMTFYNELAVGKPQFTDLCKEFQTALASVFFQYGTAKTIRSTMISNDYKEVVNAFLHFTTHTVEVENARTNAKTNIMQYYERRCQEARYFLNGIPDANTKAQSLKLIENREKEWEDAKGVRIWW